MNTPNDESTRDLWLLLEMSRGSHEAFVAIFRKYYGNLVVFCNQYIRRRDICQDIAQTIFLKLWEQREGLAIDTSLKSYLIRAAQNMCLNEIKHNRVRTQYASDVLSSIPYTVDTHTENTILYSDLVKLIDSTIAAMPPKERQVWDMSREGGLRNNEIAEALGVSLRTVELRLSKAKAMVRDAIRRHWPAISVFITMLLYN